PTAQERDAASAGPRAGHPASLASPRWASTRPPARSTAPPPAAGRTGASLHPARRELVPAAARRAPARTCHSRRPEHGQETIRLELLQQPLNLAVAPEVELGVLDVERLQAAVRAHVVAAHHDGLGPERNPLDRVYQILQCPLVL